MRVKYHTNLKHRLLGIYLNISVDAQKKHKRPIYFVDLFCGDGMAENMHKCPNWDGSPNCTCEGFERENPKKKIWCRWPGSPLIALKWAEKAEKEFYCVFNDKNENYIETLKKRKTPIRKQKIASSSKIKKIFPGKNANKIYKKVLKLIPKKAHSLFFLDPYKYSQLHWKTVKGIASHSKKEWRNGKIIKRRPELFISLMTSTMQRAIKSDSEGISKALGVEEEVWKPKIKNTNNKSYEVFLELYIKKLEGIYDQEPSFVEIRQVGKGLEKGKGPVLYYLIFVSAIPRVMEIFNKRVKKYHKKKYKSTFSKEWYRLKGYKTLGEYLN